MCGGVVHRGAVGWLPPLQAAGPGEAARWRQVHLLPDLQQRDHLSTPEVPQLPLALRRGTAVLCVRPAPQCDQ
eukprot:981384-Prorocentrum_minimum.AAC.1